MFGMLTSKKARPGEADVVTIKSKLDRPPVPVAKPHSTSENIHLPLCGEPIVPTTLSVRIFEQLGRRGVHPPVAHSKSVHQHVNDGVRVLVCHISNIRERAFRRP